MRFERMAVLVANHTGASAAVQFCQLPEGLRAQYEIMQYTELIRPLVWRDRISRQLSWARIARYYAISEMQARTIVRRGLRAPFCCGDPQGV